MSCILRYSAAAFALFITPAIAAGTHFGFKQIIVAGSANVRATALNNKSAFVGTYMDAGGATHGFIQHGSVPTVLPPPINNCSYPCVPSPTAINASGDVVGSTYYGQVYGFLWHNGAYVPAGSVVLGVGGGATIGINNKGEEFYDSYMGSGIYTAWEGMPGAFKQITPPGSFPFVSGLNNEGVVVGQFDPYPYEVFTEDKGVYMPLLPPDAIDAFGGFINDHGAVAGVFQTSDGLPHGFVFDTGRYTSFTVPGTPIQIAVQGINNDGRVVGIYTDTTKNIQRAFMFNGSTVSVFGSFPVADAIRTAINDEGTMLVSDNKYGQNASASWRVRCGGTGC